MTKDELFQEVAEIIEEVLSVDLDRITMDANFIKDLKADSLDRVDLIMAFEDKYDLDIPQQEANNIKSVKDAIDYLQKKLN